jgi:hypothetical protein
MVFNTARDVTCHNGGARSSLSGFKSRNHRKYLILVPPAASSAARTYNCSNPSH